mmetsp:Transcript_51452/g.137308  ORF Transcript_51452/g.137308 Transcript_51452/m.137308 type:complete len:491 (-) Transcript_51452:72-1544(-)
MLALPVLATNEGETLAALAMEEVTVSPRHGASNTSSVVLVDDTLRLNTSVRRGEAILVENAIVLSPADEGELDALVARMCDPTEVAARRTASVQETASSWLSLREQLVLVAVETFVRSPESSVCEAFRELAGDLCCARWAVEAQRFWSLLRQDLREKLDRNNVDEFYSLVAGNAREDESRAGLFHFGGYIEHSCCPNAFMEIVAPEVSRMTSPGSPRTGPPTPKSVQVISEPHLPQLVVRAQRDLADGELVTISYVPVYLPTWKRRELLDDRSVSCSCDRCEHAPELVCAYICPHCNDGPCCPMLPCSTPGSLSTGTVLRCEACDAVSSDLSVFSDAESSEDESGRLHPHHHRLINRHLASLPTLEPLDLVRIADLVLDAHVRIFGSCSPLYGKLCELEANAHLEVSNVTECAAAFQRAAEFYASSHRGAPEAPHYRRCYDQKSTVMAGRLGAMPRRLSKLGTESLKVISMPSLKEDIEEGHEETNEANL